MLSQFRSFWPGSSSAPASSTATTVPAASATESCPAAVMPTTSVIAARSRTESRLTRLRRVAVQSCVSLLWVSLVSLFGNIHPLLLDPRAAGAEAALITALILGTPPLPPPTHRWCSGGSFGWVRAAAPRDYPGGHRDPPGRQKRPPGAPGMLRPCRAGAHRTWGTSRRERRPTTPPPPSSTRPVSCSSSCSRSPTLTTIPANPSSSPVAVVDSDYSFRVPELPDRAPRSRAGWRILAPAR